MKRVWSQCQKELIQIQRDRLTLALAFVLPLMTLLIFGFAIRLEVKHIPLAVQDYDHSALSRAYAAQLYATNQFDPVAWSGFGPGDPSDPAVVIDQGWARAVVVIPPHFARDLSRQQAVTVQVLVDGSDVNNARIIQNSIKATTGFFVQVESLRSAEPAAVSTQTRLWFNPGRKESLNIVPGVFVLILAVYPALLTGVATVREKEKGTIVQVYASSMGATEWLLGKWLAYEVLSLGIAVFTMGLGSLLFHLHFAGDPTPLLVGTPLFIATSVGFGLMIGARSAEQNSTVQAVALAMFLTTLLLSGFIYPISNIPFPLSILSYIVPGRYYILITRDAFVRGIGWPGVWPTFPILLGIALLEFNAARRTLQRMQLPAE